uniref:Uncharacterized protein n=1 Tax=Ipomoea trifida TaxID=35884 RepID=A0A921_IPOTF|nr:hypothetical protein [Ipomoea trifida]
MVQSGQAKKHWHIRQYRDDRSIGGREREGREGKREKNGDKKTWLMMRVEEKGSGRKGV